MTTNIQVSLIVPCYNEEINIQKGVLDRIGNFTNHDARFKEVLIVDDGSTDNSKLIIKKQYLAQFPKLRLIENHHLGKAQTLIAGIKQAKSNIIMFTDIDLATPIEEGDKLLKSISEGYDIVIGSRKTHREGAPILRKLMAVGFIFIRNLIIGLNAIKDTQCGFKVFKRNAALDIISRLKVFKPNETSIEGSSVKAGFDLEFLFLAQKLKYKIAEIPVTWKHVETKNVNFLKDSIETIKDIITIKYYELTNKYD